MKTIRTNPLLSDRRSSLASEVLRRVRHRQALLVYLALVGLHFSEHLAQLVQVYAFGVSPRMAGGLLGAWFPGLASTELLHTAYNSLQLTGLILLWPGFRGRARRWWTLALVFQGWHFAEHALLQAQYVTGRFLFGAPMQTSLLETLIPRMELHLIYNAVVLVPTVLGAWLCLRRRDPLCSEERIQEEGAWS